MLPDTSRDPGGQLALHTWGLLLLSLSLLVITRETTLLCQTQIAQGTPESGARIGAGYTGNFLRQILLNI